MTDIREEAAKLIRQRFPSTDITRARGMACAAFEVFNADQSNRTAPPVGLDPATQWLRDTFAGQALMGLLAMPQEKLQWIIGREEYGFDDLMAVNAYAMADAMLRAREVKS